MLCSALIYSSVLVVVVEIKTDMFRQGREGGKVRCTQVILDILARVTLLGFTIV